MELALCFVFVFASGVFLGALLYHRARVGAAPFALPSFHTDRMFRWLRDGDAPGNGNVPGKAPDMNHGAARKATKPTTSWSLRGMGRDDKVA